MQSEALNFPVAHGEDGCPVLFTDFDYDAVEQGLAGVNARPEFSDLTQDDIDRGLIVVRVLLEWIWQCGMKNAEGTLIRAILVCWIFLKPLRSLELSDLGRGFGKPKQSFGRWHDNFKRSFPRIKTPHMRS
jgi:hypothetical protein